MKIEDILQQALDEIQLELAELKSSELHYRDENDQSTRWVYTNHAALKIQAMQNVISGILQGND